MGSGTSGIRLLAVDIDGTLVNSHNQLTDTTRAALRRALESGIRVVLATGRRYSRALPLVEPLGLDVPLVTASGALIKHPATHDTLFRADFPRQTLREMLAIIAQAGYDAVLYGDTYEQGFDFYCCRTEVPQPELAEYLALNPGRGRHWPAIMVDPPPEVFAGFCMGTHAQMSLLAQALHARLPGALELHVLRSPLYTGYMCELLPRGVSKWSGIRHLADQWAVADEEICAVGDDVNDIPMLRAAGLGVAMGNALPEVQAAADRVAPAHDDDGLAEVVRWLLDER
jgi:Cof subfamily protein (haloacid dehalogenase superfamily)